MNANLPTGGKSQPNPVTASQASSTATTRSVRVETLQKLSVEQLEAKIAALPAKIKRKAEGIEKRINKMREKLTAYEGFKRAEVEACKRLLAEKKKAASAPNAGQPAPVKAA